MAEFKHHRLEQSGGVARIIFDRPKHNVLNIEMMNELSDVLEGLLGQTDLACVVIAANGPSWSAGVDVGEHVPEKIDEMIRSFNRIFEQLARFEVPLVAAVHGRALGGGMEMAIACDVVIAGQSAVFGQPEVKLGFFPPYAAVRLPQLVGPARAVEICCSGRTYGAEEAARLGLVSRVVPDGSLSEEVDKLVGEIRQSSPLILRLNKRAVLQSVGRDFEGALQGVTDLFLGTLMKTADTREGIKSFFEKRKPVWQNQ